MERALSHINFGVKSSQQSCSTIATRWQMYRTLIQELGQAAPKEWYHQFLEPNMDTKSLADDINKFFVSLTDHFSPIVHTGPQPVPEELYVTVDEVFRSLSSVNVSKAIGPDCLHNRLLKEFVYELAPLIEDLYNQSLREGAFPSLLKSSIVTPVPKVNPPNHIESDLRPMSLTCTLA